MRALTWQGTQAVSVEDCPDPSIIDPTDAIIEVTSTAICGSDLHLYKVLGPFLDPGDILGHEAMGIVAEVGSEVTGLRPGDRVVVPFVIACGKCWMCARGLHTQCETTAKKNRDPALPETGAALFGYTKLYGQVPGGQADFLRVPYAGVGPVIVPDDGEPDERYLYLSDVLPTAWQAVDYAEVPSGGTVAVLGLGPIGQMAARIAGFRGADTVIGIDPVPERRRLAEQHGITTLDLDDDVVEQVWDATGRGADSVIDAVGMEAHGSPFAQGAQTVAGWLPDALAKSVFTSAGVDRLAALHSAIAMVRRGGTISISGVYGGAVDPMPMLTLLDRKSTRLNSSHVAISYAVFCLETK